jgi:hypothetical protein
MISAPIWRVTNGMIRYYIARQPQNFTNTGGVLDFYASDHKPLFLDLTKEEFTYQMSDHLPLWIQINTDIDGIVLDQIIQRKQP